MPGIQTEDYGSASNGHFLVLMKDGTAGRCGDYRVVQFGKLLFMDGLAMIDCSLVGQQLLKVDCSDGLGGKKS